ncbi:MAG: DEAD/DEAH box helicase, partial [Chlorobiales bacterium]|nr:DEAD/DEAH box helicase [Chlorobiales bacterium]
YSERYDMRKFTLRKYQQEAVDVGVRHLINPKNKNAVAVLPTGAGKSLVISNTADRLNGNTLILQPSKEILEQNFIKLKALGRTDVSIFSASMGIKRIDKITLATIGSIHKKSDLFHQFSQVLVDECDLVNAKEGMYKNFFDQIGKPVLGYTATPWRMMPGFKLNHGGYSGFINRIITRTKPKFFHDIIHITQINDLYDQGYLCPIEYVTSGSTDQMKLTLNSTGNDYTDATYTKISNDIIRDSFYAVRRAKTDSSLVFVKRIDDAIEITDMLNNIDIPSAYVTGDMKKTEREDIIEKYINGHYKCICNVGVLTVGFDHPKLSHIVVGRPINSARLWYQILGRGIRIHPDKDKCIVDDLCGNVARLGKIEDWIIKDENGDKKYRLYNKSEPLTGIDIKSGVDYEKNSSTNLKNKKDFVFTFGKHKGQKPSDCPSVYLQWIVDNFSPGYIRNLCKDELSKRALTKGINHVS